MKLFRLSLTLLVVCFLPFLNLAQEEYDLKEHYQKTEVDIPMREGTKLHTTIYSPRNTSRNYPILMQQTPYSSRPYGEDQFPSLIGPNPYLMKEGYIIVYQDVRGRWMSKGKYNNMRAIIADKSGEEFDESSDTYDTTQWLIHHVDNNKARVRTWGISYPEIEQNSNNYNIMAFGPWSHWDWVRSARRQAVGNVYFGNDISKDYQKNVETKFFNHFLKEAGNDSLNLAEAYVYHTGARKWNSYHSNKTIVYEQIYP